MPIQSIQLKQDPRDLDKRWLELTRAYDPSKGAMGYPEQYTLNKDQFARLANSGIQVQQEWNNPLYYNQGQFSPDLLKRYANEPNIGANGGLALNPETFNRARQITQSAVKGLESAQKTTSQDLANNPTEQQRMLDYAVGGKYNPQTPGGLNAQILQAAKEGKQIDPTVSRTAQSGGDVNMTLRQISDQQRQQQTTTKQQYGQPLILPSGQTISPQDPNYAIYVQQMGVTQQPSATQQSIDGIDTSGWSPAMRQSYDAIKQYSDKLLARNKVLNPNVTIDDTIINKFMDQAKTELGPYYNQLFSQSQSDVKKELDRLSQDYTARERQLGLGYGKELESAQESYARRGLAFSSERQRTEQELAGQAKTTLEATQQAATRQAEDIGTKGERMLGSSMFPAGTAGITTGTRPITGMPGGYGFDIGKQTRQLFQPLGGVTGELGRSQMFDVEARKKQLLGSERELRSEFYL